MDWTSKIPKESKYEETNEFSRCFFYWMFPLFRTGSKEELDFHQISSCPNSDEPERVAAKLEREWAKELTKFHRPNSKYSPSLAKAIARAFGVKFILANVLVLVGELFKLAQPFMIGVIVHNLSSEYAKSGQEPPKQTKQLVDFSAAAFVISSVLNVITRHRGNILLTRIGNNVRTALTMMVFKKILVTSSSSLSEGSTNIGNIMNVLANDLNRFEELSWILIFVVLGPFMGIFVMYVTWVYLGIAFLGGLVMLIIFIIFQAYMSRYFNKFRSSTAKVTDERVKCMSELISAIKLIKVYCWEQPFAEQVDEIRKREIVKLKGTYVLKGINSSLFFIATRIMLFASFIWRVLLNGELTAVALFITMPLYDAIRIPVTHSFSYAIGVGAETLIACQRIEKILLMKEKSNLRVKMASGHRASQSVNNNKVIGTIIANCAFVESSVKLANYFGKWTTSVPHNNLVDVTFNIEKGEFVIIIGAIGSGKSCLLNAFLGEIETTSGDLIVNGNISYAPQEAWVFGGTVRTNILLGLEKSYDEERYSKVLQVCNLNRDLGLMPNYDETFVGEKGYSLSGGQKARLSLARCVYNENAEIYLFDDPLSAVDPKVANSLFSEVMLKFLSDKTRILVTHQLQFLPRADKILLLNNGSVEFFGTYDQLLNSAIDIGSIMSEQNDRKADLKRQTSCTDETRVRSASSRRSSTIDAVPLAGDEPEADPEELDEEPVRQKVNREEDRKVGRLDPKIYWKYLTAGDHKSFLILSFLFSLAAQGMYQLNDTWLSAWAAEFDSSRGPNVSQSNEPLEKPVPLGRALISGSTSFNITIYSCLTVILFIFGFARTFFTFLMCLSSSIKLHDTIFKRLLRAPMSFYENNFLGRILNRVTRDIGIIDQNIPNSMCDLQLCITQVLGIVILCFCVNGWLIIPVVVLGAISYPIRGLYISTARALQRLDSLARSPVYNSVSSTLSGLIVIRSYGGLTGQLLNQFAVQVKDSVSCRFYVLCAQRAVGLALDLITNVYVTAIVIVVMTTNISPGDAGLILASSTQLMGFFNYCVRATADLETQMISCERVLEYSKLPSEAELIIAENEPPANWPSNGKLEFKSVNLWYDKALPAVLKSISFTVWPGDKIGIVGRTGAGKSSLISVLFRLVEPEGTILIDQINISAIGLHQLRNKVSIIPQDPTLFSGTIRSNLDPFNKYSDDQMWQVLRLSNLFDAVSAMKGGLDASVLEGGANLSVGQRQLLCLARALLKRNSILICDEATANVDQATDELIQVTIKQEFRDCTVLTIAHRLNTIIDMDRVLVMDAGKVVEFDEPYILLQNSIGFFYSMVKQTGPQFEKLLHSLAKKAHEERKVMRIKAN